MQQLPSVVGIVWAKQDLAQPLLAPRPHLLGRAAWGWRATGISAGWWLPVARGEQCVNMPIRFYVSRQKRELAKTWRWSPCLDTSTVPTDR